MTEVDYVHASPGDRVAIQFEPHQATLQTSPIRWRDWVRRFWWSVVGSFALSWVGFLAYQAGAPRAVATVLAIPIAIMFVLFLGCLVASILVMVFSLDTREMKFAWLARWVDRRAKPAQPLGAIPLGAVAQVATDRRFRRTVVRVTFTDQQTVTYTRWGYRHFGRVLSEGFQALAAQNPQSPY